jgi:hypothetical protein
MFALIVTIISIALVGLIALATLYYGGDSINQGAEQAAISRYLSEGVQVQGALELYRVDNGVLPTGTKEQIQQQLLDGHYLKSWPAGEWTLVNDYAVRTDLSLSACEAINKKMNVSVVPTCGDPAFTGRNLCCSTL